MVSRAFGRVVHRTSSAGEENGSDGQGSSGDHRKTKEA